MSPATTNARRARSLTLDAGVEAVIIGRDDLGEGGLEGVTNGGRSAVATFTSAAAADTTVHVEAQAITGGPWARSTTSYSLPAGGELVVPLSGAILAGYALRLVAVNAAGGVIRCGWSIAR